jgi:dephospho-CoA kinase
LAQPTIKLALVGRAYSGKKTIAQAMKEILGNDVAILNLDDIIREAIEYISPKKQDESVVIDPKAKGKRGAIQETVHVDIFEGKNTA